MGIFIEKLSSIPVHASVVILCSNPAHLSHALLDKQETDYIKEQHTINKIGSFAFNRLTNWVFVRIVKQDEDEYRRWENCRKLGDEMQASANQLKLQSLVVTQANGTPRELMSFAEGLVLGSYQFIKYFQENSDKANTLMKISVASEQISDADILDLNILLDAVCRCRDLVNEPVMFMNAEKLAASFTGMGNEAGIKVEAMNKKKIESLKMGGLLAVNKGSVDPPTFTIMEWKPTTAINKKPVVLVGKGVVYDTGGLNIKTGNYMEDMKSDMSGGAVVASVLFACAKHDLPLHLIALIPATDNRLNGNAYASGDIITMYNGTSVEVINTDAEGRLILADALSYAKKYDPQLVINVATLTGSAQRAIGKFGVVAMHAQATKEMELLKHSGYQTGERVAEFPFWDDYADLIKSDIADLKNTGPPEAGMITAGKFLEKFTDYPFIHLDIAGVAFTSKRDNYRNTGGTGFGVRLLIDFIKYYFQT